jgi:hypothetical protein
MATRYWRIGKPLRRLGEEDLERPFRVIQNIASGIEQS